MHYYYKCFVTFVLHLYHSHLSHLTPYLFQIFITTFKMEDQRGIITIALLELFNLTSACSGRRSLRSATKGDFLVPRARTASRQKRAFSIVGPSVWNDLPSELRSLPGDLSSSFYKLLKTLLFGRAWAGSASE